MAELALILRAGDELNLRQTPVRPSSSIAECGVA